MPRTRKSAALALLKGLLIAVALTLACMLLMAASRKRVIGQPCGNPPFRERMAGTLAAHTAAQLAGADMLRVHDVEEAVQAARVTDALLHLG